MLALLLAAVVAAPPGDIVHPKERAAYKALLTQKALSADTVFAGAPCPDARARNIASQATQIPGHATVRVLHEKVEVNGCGRTSNQNIYVIRLQGSPPWRMANTMPGDSLVDMNLQATVWSAAVKQGRADLPKDCQGQRLEDIYVAARPGHVSLRTPGQSWAKDRPGWFTVALPPELAPQAADLDMRQAWAEIWPMAVCGQDRTMAVVFIPMHDHTRSAYAFVPIWRAVQAQGAMALPQPAPEGAGGPDAGQTAAVNPAP